MAPVIVRLEAGLPDPVEKSLQLLLVPAVHTQRIVCSLTGLNVKHLYVKVLVKLSVTMTSAFC